nr:MAG TPA: hypothetical protein [Crassvirales sp.]DAN01141.1 MAG TPA: hypothetical protein [Crassvirales sp.]DAW72402.1 MAG TPA: hypothetical protein [Caudoviricetes sp.]
MLSTLYIRAIVGVLVIIWLIITYIRYHPSISIVKSYNRYLVLLWYNKYHWDNTFQERVYIKLFSI